MTLAIIDTAGGVSAATTAAIRYCDFCLIPARPSVADIEASAATLGVARAWQKPFAFILNQTPIRGQRINNAAGALGDEAARELDDVLARPFIVMRNDHQDALAAGLAVSEFSPLGKSAEEIRDLWQWVETRLNDGVCGQRGNQPRGFGRRVSDHPLAGARQGDCQPGKRRRTASAACGRGHDAGDAGL